MHIGIDDFWRINSSCGSDYGDYILKNVADCMKECRKKFEFSLKCAKKMGKNSFYSFQQEDYNVFLRKEKIIAALRRSIAERYEGFDVYYQPIMDCASETMVGAEALMRFTMNTEEGMEVISPMEFIPLLEETGLIIPAGRFILKEAAKICLRSC